MGATPLPVNKFQPQRMTVLTYGGYIRVGQSITYRNLQCHEALKPYPKRIELQNLLPRPKCYVIVLDCSCMLNSRPRTMSCTNGEELLLHDYQL